MLNSKQRAYLRTMANGIDAIFQIGKGGINDNLISQLKDVLNTRELIKITVLETCELSSKEAAPIVADLTKSNVVQVIGTKFVLYKPSDNEKNRKIDIKGIGK